MQNSIAWAVKPMVGPSKFIIKEKEIRKPLLKMVRGTFLRGSCGISPKVKSKNFLSIIQN